MTEKQEGQTFEDFLKSDNWIAYKKPKRENLDDIFKAPEVKNVTPKPVDLPPKKAKYPTPTAKIDGRQTKENPTIVGMECKPKTAVIQVHLSTLLIDKIDAAAKKIGLKRTEFIRIFLTNNLFNEEI